MKKHSFYTMINKNKKPTAMLVDGYSDGTYYYYRAQHGTWYAVHPLCGLSVANGRTKKEVEGNANKAGLLETVRAFMEKRGAEMTAEYEKAIKEARECAI